VNAAPRLILRGTERACAPGTYAERRYGGAELGDREHSEGGAPPCDLMKKTNLS